MPNGKWQTKKSSEEWIGICHLPSVICHLPRFGHNKAMRFLLGCAVALLLSATAAHAADDWAALARQTHALLVTRPADPDLLNLYGYYRYRQGITRDAEIAFRASLQSRPRFTVAWNNLGALYLGLERYDDAEKCFRAALATDPRYSKARYNLAVTRFKQGEYREALSMYLDLRKRDQAYVDLRTNPGKAEKELDEALKKDPANPFLLAVKQRYKKYREDKEVDSYWSW